MKRPFYCSKGRTAIELTPVIGPHGESRVTFRYDGSRLRVEIRLDEENPSGKRHVELIFDGTVNLHIAAVPGVDILNLEGKGESAEAYRIGDVIESTESDAADAWSAHFGRTIRHFHVYFPNENERLDVFAEGCRLES